MFKSCVTVVIVLCAVFAVLAQSPAGTQVLVNNVGYEAGGPKRAVVQSASAITANKAYIVDAAGGRAVDSVPLGSEEAVTGWVGRNFKTVDFSSFSRDGSYRIKVGAAESPAFSVGEKILQVKTGADQLAFFNAYRSKDDRDRDLPIFGSNAKRNVYGGWFDASGDMGKHISHLSYANYFSPQQIPLVAWALLHAFETQPEAFGGALAEAAWGADFLLRALSAEGFFYMSVFDNWGDGYRWNESNRPENGSKSKGEREICAWSGTDGDRSGDYQCAMREGGGMSIAALARAFAAGASGDSGSAQYIAGAKRAYAHLKANPLKYQDDGRENIIDDYCGLLAASELYNATKEEEYRIDARARAESLLRRQSPDGWFYSGTDKDGANARPFYHAADEGLPIVALSRYYEVAGGAGGVGMPDRNAVRKAVGRNLRWYSANSQSGGANPFGYAKMYRAVNASGGAIAGGNLARGRPATASRVQGTYTADKAFDGSADNSSRWSSYQDGAQNDSQWLYVELDNIYKVDSVALEWEGAYGKHYRIDVSTANPAIPANWRTAFEIKDNNGAGRKAHKFPPVEAKYVRMFGITRGYEYGGFSLYEFEVYGELASPPPTPDPNQAKYFIPHVNETGYWWQGENARLASMAAAFAMGAAVADSGAALWKDTLFAMATAQLDWILGKNPFELCMMHGHGAKNYPNYNSTAGIENVKGGICNGITAKRSNQDDIEWAPYDEYGDSAWCNWRWIEQWLPHNAWYLAAISALSHNIEHGIPDEPEEPPVEPPIAVRHNAGAESVKFKIAATNGMGIKISLPFPADEKTEVSVYDIRGKRVFADKIPKGERGASMKASLAVARGTYIVNVKDVSGKNRAFGKVIFK